MLAVERRGEITQQLLKEKKVVVSELATKYKVSEETIRRDLEKLDHDGIATKSYGGATLRENKDADKPFWIRKNTNVENKKKIAKIVSRFVNDGDSLFIDPSSTSVFITKELSGKENLRIITNSIEVMLEASARMTWQTIATGGEVKGDYLGMSGERTIESLHSYRTKWAIVSCKGINEDYVLSEANDSFAFAKRVMIEQADKVILAIDHTKFGVSEFATVCDMKDVDIVVTDECPAESYIHFFEQNNIICLYPQE